MAQAVLHQGVFADLSLETLAELIPFEQRSVTVYGKEYPQPRLTKWYGAAPYTYSRLGWPPCDIPPLLDRIRSRLETLCSARFDSVLANFYQDGKSAVGWHSDDEPIFGSDPEIASVSFGATRRFALRRKSDGAKETYDLPHGSVLFMGKGTQPEWQHSLLRTSKPVGPRINLTYRLIRAT